MAKILEIVPYDPLWPKLFEKEAPQIKTILGDACLSVQHIGSTSIPGLAAKPKIDMMVIVKAFQRVNLHALEQLGYENKGLIATPLSYFYNKPSYHVHVFEEGDGQIDRQACFLTFLKANPDAMRAYVQLKLELAEKYKDSPLPKLHTYTVGKSDLIYAYLARAGFDGLTLNYVRSPREWETYHAIRKREIFDTIGVTYDPNHPTLTDTQHFHFSLVKGTEMIGVAHLEILDEKRIALRPFAIDNPYQNQGFGAFFLNSLEKWARLQGKKTLLLHARPEAISFYRRAGYIDMPFPETKPSINVTCLDMGKIL